MDDLSFLLPNTAVDPRPTDRAVLQAIFPDGTVHNVHGLSLPVIAEKSPLLAQCFDGQTTRQGLPKAELEVPSRSVVISALRFMYKGDYMDIPKHHVYPHELLTHVQLYKTAIDLDMPALQDAAALQVLREADFACSMPAAPADLCETIRYTYKHLEGQDRLVDILLNYCVNCFVQHSLGQHADFRNAAFDIPKFHSDLVRSNYARNFQDEGAVEILRLPVSRPNPYSKAVKDDSIGNFLCDIWADPSDGTGAPAAGSQDDEPTAKRQKMYKACGFTLVHRPKKPNDVEDSTAEPMRDSFELVERPKLPQVTNQAVSEAMDDSSTLAECLNVTKPTEQQLDALVTDAATCSLVKYSKPQHALPEVASPIEGEFTILDGPEQVKTEPGKFNDFVSLLAPSAQEPALSPDDASSQEMAPAGSSPNVDGSYCVLSLTVTPTDADDHDKADVTSVSSWDMVDEVYEQ